MQEAVGMNKQIVESRSPSDKRKMSPGQEKAALWLKKPKGTGSARREALGTVFSLQKRSCAGAKPCAFPHRHRSWKEDLVEFSQNCKEIHPCPSA